MIKQIQNVPVLRFSEFNTEWIEAKLEKIIVEYKAKSITESQHQVLTSSNKGLMKQTDYYGENRITEKDNTGFNIIPDGYITYRSRSDNRKFTFNVNNLGITGIISTYYPVFSIETGSNKFFTEYLNYHYHYIGKHSVGTSQTVLSLNELKNIKLKFPSVEEQQKIATFLTAIDEKIQQLAKKKELLKHYKKGVMQKIFNQEIRFEDDNGNDFADWEEKKGNEIFESISNKNHNSDLPILAITQDFGAIPRDLIDYQISVTDKSVESYKVVEIGDFIISLRSFQGGIEYSNYKGICSPAYIILRSKVSINDLFFKYYLKTDFYIQQLNAKLEGIRDGKMVSYRYFSEIDLPFPSLGEQNKIAAFISAIDEKINLVNKQLEKTKEYKKGLLQQMFI